MIVAQVATQLQEELGAIACGVGTVLGVNIPEDRLAPACVRLANQLCGEDAQLAAGAVAAVMTARWPELTEPSPRWWNTPVGRVIARWVAADDATAVTQSVAAAMLGVTRGTVAQLVHRPTGGLKRHSSGGVTRASVLARLARRSETQARR